MSYLRKYSSHDVLNAARALGESIELCHLPSGQLLETLRSCVVRDDRSTYWTVGLKSMEWYRFAEERWMGSTHPKERLEGSVTLGSFIKMSNQRVDAEPDSRLKDRVDRVSAFVRQVNRLGENYSLGEIDSTTVEEILTDHCLMDQQGRFWTVGFRSGNWFSFESDRWNPASGPPEVTSLFQGYEAPQSCTSCGREIKGDKFCRYCGSLIVRSPASVPAHLDAAVMSFLAHGWDTLAEPVTEQWDPPPGYPEMPLICTTCGIINVRERDQCARCGSSLRKDEAPLSCTNASCGKPVTPGTKFCPHCGHEVDGVSSPREEIPVQVCSNPECGRAVAAGKKFCTWCGTPLKR